jgi:sigma-E factor negative regulatory protein RseA
LPDSETELLLKRLTRDGVLRESFGRYALIGEALRGGSVSLMTRRFAGRVNLAIDGEPVPVNGHAPQIRASRWWRPFAGAAVAAGVAAVAVVTFHQRADAPALQSRIAASPAAVLARNGIANRVPREPISYTVPATSPAAAVMAPARLTNYVLAHSRYSSGLAQRGVLADMLIEADEQPHPAVTEAAAHVAP